MRPLWVYKCNTTAPAEGDWTIFFKKRHGQGRWGGTWCIKNRSGLRVIREELSVGDLVLAWQSDIKSAIGLCEITGLPPDNGGKKIELKTIFCFPNPVKLLSWKKKSATLASGRAFRQGNQAAIVGTTPEEAREILRLCGVKAGLLSNRRRKS